MYLIGESMVLGTTTNLNTLTSINVSFVIYFSLLAAVVWTFPVMIGHETAFCNDQKLQIDGRETLFCTIQGMK